MAATREVELLRKESIATAGTKTLDVGLTDPITRLDFIWKKTNSNRTPIAHPGKIIKSIEVVDGADVLFSMCGQDTVALAYYESGNVPGAMTNYETGQWSMVIASVFFGRRMFDDKYALDPRRFNNVQVKIAHDLALGGSTGTVADLSVYAHVFDERKIDPKGFMLSKEIYSFLPVANAWNYISLPTDYPIRALMWGANECADGPEYNLANIKIAEADEKHVLLDSETERYMFQSAARDPIYSEHVILKPSAGDTMLHFFGAPHWEREPSMMSETTGQDAALITAAGCDYQVMNEAADVMAGFLHGHIPFGQVYVPFGDDETEEWWDIRNSGSGKLSLQAGGTPDIDEYVRVYCQQIRGY